MRILISLSILILATAAFAGTQTYTVSGMHCKSCAKMIEAQMCKQEGLEKCEITVGKLVIVPKKGYQFTKEQVQAALTKAGEYKVTDVNTAD